MLIFHFGMVSEQWIFHSNMHGKIFQCWFCTLKVSVQVFLWNFKDFATHKVMSSVNRYNFLSFFPNWKHFISFSKLMPWLGLLLCWIEVLSTGILAFFIDLRRFQLFPDDYDVKGRLFIYDFYYIVVTSFYSYFVEYFSHERLVNLLDSLWLSDEAQMKFCLFLTLRKLCNAPSGSIIVDGTKITYYSSFGKSLSLSLSGSEFCVLN